MCRNNIRHGSNVARRLQRGDGLDFDAGVLGKARHLNGCARRFVAGEHFLVHLVHEGKFAHVCEEDGCLHHFAQAGARGIKNSAEVEEHLHGLLSRPGDFDCSGRWVNRELSRAKDKAVDFNGLCIGADGRGGIGCIDGVHTIFSYA